MKRDVSKWRIGNVSITQIVEHEDRSIPPGMMFPGLEPEQVKAFPWLRPHFIDEEGSLHFSVHAFIIESEGRRIVVDTCIGNDKVRKYEVWNNLQTNFLEKFESAGFPVESIDTVLCTHLHIDHVGWNTRLVGDCWVPTFPNADYLFARVEWEHWSAEAQAAINPTDPAGYLLDTSQVMADSIEPIIEAGLHLLVEADHRLTSEVSLISTAGHTPGHVSVVIESAGQRAVITGDVMHHPVQVGVPSAGTPLDSDSNAASATRHTFLNEIADKDIVVLGTHFPRPTAGLVVSEGAAWRFDTTSALPFEEK